MDTNKTEKLQMHLVEMTYGWLVTTVVKGDKEIPMQFDEWLTDPLPDLVTMYRKIQEQGDFCYRVENRIEVANQICIEEHYLGDGFFSCSVYGGVYDAGIFDGNDAEPDFDENDDDEDDEEIQMGIFNDIFSQKELLAMLRGFFNEILQYVGFPHQYPCWWCLVNDELEMVDDAIEEEKNILEEKCGERAALELERQYTRDHVHIEPEHMDFYLKYKKMLETMEVPEGWAKN